MGLLPRRANGSHRITWAPATYPAVHDLLTNPAYAGAFVFGRTRTEKRVDPITGTVRSRLRSVPREQWEVLICDHHPGCISWETYEANAARLRGNWRRPADAAREWQASLSLWTTGNHVRSVAPLLGSVLLLVGLRYR